MDAPTATVSVIYDDNGVFSGYEFYPKNPDTVMVDSGNCCESACTFICFGYGDGLATLVEVESTLRRQGKICLVENHH